MVFNHFFISNDFGPVWKHFSSSSRLIFFARYQLCGLQPKTVFFFFNWINRIAMPNALRIHKYKHQTLFSSQHRYGFFTSFFFFSFSVVHFFLEVFIVFEFPLKSNALMNLNVYVRACVRTYMRGLFMIMNVNSSLIHIHPHDFGFSVIIFHSEKWYGNDDKIFVMVHSMWEGRPRHQRMCKCLFFCCCYFPFSLEECSINRILIFKMVSKRTENSSLTPTNRDSTFEFPFFNKIFSLFCFLY